MLTSFINRIGIKDVFDNRFLFSSEVDNNNVIDVFTQSSFIISSYKMIQLFVLFYIYKKGSHYFYELKIQTNGSINWMFVHWQAFCASTVNGLGCDLKSDKR